MKASKKEHGKSLSRTAHTHQVRHTPALSQDGTRAQSAMRADWDRFLSGRRLQSRALQTTTMGSLTLATQPHKAQERQLGRPLGHCDGTPCYGTCPRVCHFLWKSCTLAVRSVIPPQESNSDARYQALDHHCAVGAPNRGKILGARYAGQGTVCENQQESKNPSQGSFSPLN